MSEDMSSYCSAHDEWLIMKLCMYVGYHDANNVSNFCGDPVTQLNLKNVIYYYLLCFTVLRTWRSIAVTRSQFLRRLLRDHAQLQQYGRPESIHRSDTVSLCLSLACTTSANLFIQHTYIFPMTCNLNLSVHTDTVVINSNY